MSSMGGNNNQWSWLVVVCLAHAGWQQGGHGTTVVTMVERCIWRLILLVFFVQFYVGVIVIVAEYRLISNINDNML